MQDKPLILELPGEKRGSEEVPANIQSWPTVALQSLQEQAPYLFEGTRQVPKIDQIDSESGSGFGMVIIQNHPAPRRRHPGVRPRPVATGQELRQVAIPVTIRDFRLDDFDVMVTDQGKFLPLTPRRYAQVAFRPTPFVGVEKPTAPTSVHKQQQPPYGLAYGYGGRVGGTQRYASYEGSNPGMDAVEGKSEGPVAPLHEAVRKAKDYYMGGSGEDRIQYRGGKDSKLKRLLSGSKPTGDDYQGAVHALLPMNVIRLERLPDGNYRITEVSDVAFYPRKRVLTEIELLSEYGTRVPNLLEEMAGREGDAVITVDHEERAPFILEEYTARSRPLQADGGVLVGTIREKFPKGRLFVDVMRFDGSHDPTLKVFTDGYVFGCQGTIVGEVLDPSTRVVATVPRVGAWGLFAHTDVDGHVEVTIPFEVMAHHEIQGRPTLRVVTLDHEDLTLIIEDGIDRIYSATGINDPMLAQHVGAAIFKVPSSHAFVHLGQHTALMDDTMTFDQAVARHFRTSLKFGPEAIAHGQADHPHVIVTHYTDGTYSMHGKPVEGIAGKEKISRLQRKDALFRLCVLGLGLEGGNRVLDAAITRTHATVAGLKEVDSLHAKVADLMATKNELEKFCSVIRVDLSKEAKKLPQGDTLDAVLSLGYLTPENLETFLDEVPLLQRAEEDLAKLLFLVRVGQSGFDENSIERAMRAINDVNESLEFLLQYRRTQKARGTDGRSKVRA